LKFREKNIAAYNGDITLGATNHLVISAIMAALMIAGACNLIRREVAGGGQIALLERQYVCIRILDFYMTS
jgi:hypothetical protein